MGSYESLTLGVRIWNTTLGPVTFWEAARQLLFFEVSMKKKIFFDGGRTPGAGVCVVKNDIVFTF